MGQDPFPDPGVDGEEPDGSALSPAAGTGPDAEDPGPPEQGLFVCLPAEDLDVSRFAQHGESDSMPPGPLLAEVVHALTGEDGGSLAALSDDQLMGIIAAARRLESRVAWTQLAAIREFAARQKPGRAGFAADELAYELHMTAQSAAAQIDYASAVASRLPRTFAALAAGQIHPVHLRIIDDETSILSPADAAGADEELAGKAGSLTCVTTPRPSLATGPAVPCGTWSAPGMPDVPRRAAASRPPGATWTTPSPGTMAGSPARAIWPRPASDNHTGCSSTLKKVTQFACGMADLTADRCERPSRERPGAVHRNAHMSAV